MSRAPLALAAARNNAEWCDAFCRTHGVEARFSQDVWASSRRTPPYYPDAVTLRPHVDAERLLGLVDAGDGCSIKDSFADLDLARHGFDVLFRAEWVALEHSAYTAAGEPWSVVATDEHLAEWEAAWRGSPSLDRFFRSALLRDETVAVLARREGDGVVAGAIANRSAAVVGLSNVFDTRGDLASVWAGGAVAAAAVWRGLPLVGYDAGDALAAAQEAGFASVGDLVVWARNHG